jgi:hypothetical protein
MSEVIEMKKADPKYDWRPVISKLAEEYTQVYGDQIDYDTIFEFIREKNEEKQLVGYEEWDYSQAVMEHLMALKEADEIDEQIPDIPEPDEEDEEEDEEPEQKPKRKIEPKTKIVKRKKPVVEKKEQGHLEFTCYKSLLRNFSKKIRVAGNEVKINADEKGLSCRMVDDAHVCMVEVMIPNNDFYVGTDCVTKQILYKIDKPVEIGIDLNDLDAVLKLLDGLDRIHVTICETEMILETTNDKPIRKKMKLIDTCGMPDFKEPKIELELEAEIDRRELGILQKATANTGGMFNSTEGKNPIDKVQLVSDGKYLKAILLDVDDEGELTITLSKKVKGTGKCLYDPEYLNQILSAMTENKPVTIKWGVDVPVKFIGKLQDNGNYCYLLAPRIESE